MNLTNNTILITGGASGIGFALAKRFIQAKNKVIICGRRMEQLEKAKKECPEIHIIQCDVSKESERQSLFQTVSRDFPELNVLINNAGIQNRPPQLRETQDWEMHAKEIEINLKAPMHLAMLFIPFLMNQTSPAIMNVSSGLAFCPISFMPTYCATKAALHSFTLSLRHQLSKTAIKVVEIIPPAVNTDLGGVGLHNDGTPLDVFADHAVAQIAKGELEFGFGFSEKGRLASREEINGLFSMLNKG